MSAPKESQPKRSKAPLVIWLGVVVLLGAGVALFRHAQGETNTVALASSPKGVTVVEAQPATYRPLRRYVGTIQPWLSAKVGPQLVSAYVDTVLVRPGDRVRRGQIIATLDCRNASASNRALAMQARAVETNQAATAKEASRIEGLLAGGFATPNEVELKKAESTSKQAQLQAMHSQLESSSLQVSDCVLKAPFDGEVAERLADPGTFIRPGSAIATIVDRSIVRAIADAPEDDFEALEPQRPVALKLLATKRELTGVIARRAPAADASTRTIHFEIDLNNPARDIPVGTTAELSLAVGEPQVATEIPLTAASVKGSKASVYVVAENTAHQKSVKVLGERGGSLFLADELPPGSWVVSEGRAGLADNDPVTVKKDTFVQTAEQRVADPSASVASHTSAKHVAKEAKQ